MRKIFSSQRVENAEGVAQMLREAGIEARISNGRSYHSKRRGQFSYLDATTRLPNTPSAMRRPKAMAVVGSGASASRCWQ